MEATEYKSTNSPKKKGEVIVTFLNDRYLAGSIVDLGQHALDKKITESHSIPVEAYNNISQYNVRDHGFQTVKFEKEFWKKLDPIIQESTKLSDTQGINENLLEDITQDPINHLQDWMSTFYSEQFKLNKESIQVVASRHLVLRAAGCSETSCNIPANPLIHLDYIDFDKTYKRQCEDQKIYKYPTICPDKKDLIDVLNIWFPTTDTIIDWPLGFIPLKYTDIPDYIPIELVVGSIAASMRYKKGLEIKIVYKEKMEPREAYVFRSATDSNDISKKGVMHSSFRITDEKHIRKSAELRLLIFKKPESSTNSLPQNVGGFKKYIKSKKNLKHKNRNKNKKTHKKL
jgi:hypothetical protein